MSISLYRKYRPQSFAQVIGQQHIVQTLSNAIAHNRIGHAYLLTGPRGTGKTTLARIFAKAVNCTNSDKGNPCCKCEICHNIGEGKSLDIFEIDAASNTGVENIRELRENVKFPPSQAKFKVYIIDEVHMLSTGAFNALLKTLEEPPAHVIFILATTEIHKVPETIISRCQRFDFTRLSIEHIIKKLSLVAENEGVKVEKSALEMIAIAAEGGMRDAESLFSQVISLEDKNITSKEVEEILGTTKRQHIEQIVDFILEKNLQGAIALIDTLSQEGYDLEIFHKALLNYLRQVMLLSIDQSLVKTFSFELTSEQAAIIQKQAKNQSPQDLVRIINCLSEIQGKIKSSFIPQLPLELALVNAINGVVSLNIVQTQQQPTIKPPATQYSAPAQQIAPVPTSTHVPTPAPAPSSEKKMEQPTPIVAPQPVAIQTPIAPIEIPTASEPIENINPAPQNTDNITLNNVTKFWNAFLNEAKTANHSFGAILPNCQVISVNDNTITIAAKFGFHRDKINENANRLTLETIFAKILGSKVLIKAVTEEEAGVKIGIKSSIYTTPVQSNQISHGEQSDLLAQAKEMFGGGEIVG